MVLIIDIYIYLFRGNVFNKIYINLYLIKKILFIFSLLGVYFIDKKYLTTIDNIYHFYIAIFLLIRFNPFTEYDDSEIQYQFSKDLGFSAGLYLLISSAFFTYLKYYASELIQK